MAADDYSLLYEVRQQTGADSLEDPELTALVSRAKRQIETELDTDVADWYTDRNTETALFWLTCIFAVGEVGGTDSFAVGELSVDSNTETSVPKAWQDRYERALAVMQGGSSRAFGHATVNRSDRTYDSYGPTL